MGVLSIGHPAVIPYIQIRLNHPEVREWKFNLSVNLTDEFMRALKIGTFFTLRDGTRVYPNDLMCTIACNAHATGDPGVVFLDRIME